MKTKNNTQKTALKAAAVATGLVILSFTVYAQETMKPLFENNETSNIAMVTGKMSKNSFAPTNTISLIKADAFASYLVKATEEEMKLEDWMLEENNFTTKYQIKTETESPLEVENWMTKESSFDANSFNLEVEMEEELNVEAWMLDESNFNGIQNNSASNEPKLNNKVFSTSTFFFKDVVIESKISVEKWMTDPNVWEK
jgi:hypothetical protein